MSVDHTCITNTIGIYQWQHRMKHTSDDFGFVLDNRIKTNGRNLGCSSANHSTGFNSIDDSNGTNDRRMEILAAENRQEQQ